MHRLIFVLTYFLLAVQPGFCTVVAWDGQTLASDSQATKGHAKIFGRCKFVRSEARHAVLVGAGDCKILDTIKDFWMQTDKPLSEFELSKPLDPGTFPNTHPDPPDFAVLVIPDVGEAKYYEGDLSQGVTIEPPYSFGTGEDFAMAAMSLGKNAAEAVQTAEGLDIYCGGKVHTIKAPQPETVTAETKKK